MLRSGSIVVAVIMGITATVQLVRADEAWNFHVIPYLWGAGIDGTVGVAGRDVSVNESFSDLVQFVNKGGAVRFEARKGKWGGLVDYFGVTLKDSQTVALGTIHTTAKQSISEAGLTRRIAPSVELLAGARHQSLDNDISLPVIGTLSDSRGWTDGFGGARWTPIDTDKWLLWVRGDVGAGSSDLTWLASAGAGYRFAKHVGVLVAYRYLKTNYQDGGFKWDVAQKGFGLGLDITW